MKISYRILFINFAIVVLIVGTAALAFYSIMYNVLSSQQSKYLNNSANSFIYFYREALQNTDDDFLFYLKSSKNFSLNEFQYPEKNLDFIFSIDNSSASPQKIYSSFDIDIPQDNFSIKNFLEKNPFAIINSFKLKSGIVYYYGRILNEKLLNHLSQKIGAEITVVLKETPVEISNSSINQKYIFALMNANKKLSSESSLQIYSQEAESSDILATLYIPVSNFEKNENIKFLIFTSLNEAADLRNNLKYIVIVIGVSGVVLSLILTFLFTDKIRKQITLLSKATKFIREGDFSNRINIKSKDEFGKLANAFNNMQETLSKNQKARNEYSDFIALINQNPTLTQISEASLSKIIKTCNFNIGAIYSIDNNHEHKISLICSYGINAKEVLTDSIPFFEPVIKNKETLELNSSDDLPIIKTGILSLRIQHLLIIPVIYSSGVIAILELGSIDNPSEEARQYLSNIQEQLAIGLTNAKALAQLADLVNELKKLNDDYQIQNEQVRKQNDTLIHLHNQLKEKAEELTIQKQKAEESTQLKSQFLASMSHELRTPMNSILGLTELILEEPTLSNRNKERLQVVLTSGRRLMGLINDILDLSKIEAGKMELHPEEVAMDSFLAEIETVVRPLIDKKSLEFRLIKHSNTNIIINTDRGKIAQVLMNLLGNAVKFTEAGEVELHITIIDNKILKFDVIDSGIGISEEDQKIIFEEFRQIDGTTTRKYNGTGLGLSICKKIADILEGEINVQSEIGKGSIFSFTLPINAQELKNENKLDEINLINLQKNIKNPVLVIDDDSEVRYTIGQYLMSKGYEVAYAEDGEKGIEEAIRIQPFAITLDIMLPGKDGWSTLKDLKENPITKDIPVILISIISDKKLGFGLGAFEYYVKPISAQKLFSAFSQLENLVQKKIKKIAVVDKDEDEIEKLKNEIQDGSILIEGITDELNAFEKIAAFKPDLIVINLLMGNLNGISLSRQLKGNRETRKIPIILFTEKEISDKEKEELNKVVENITVKEGNHPLDVLKIVRDRLKLQEDFSAVPERNLEMLGKEVVNIKSELNNFSQTDLERESGENFGEVLIVDDEPEVLFTLSELVHSCNCGTILAKSGIECLKILENNVPDLILLDIMMPGMDGFQTIKKIKEIQSLKDIPVFAVSAKAMSEDKKIILKYGFQDFIPKPVDSLIIAYKLKKIFSQIVIPGNEKNISYR